MILKLIWIYTWRKIIFFSVDIQYWKFCKCSSWNHFLIDIHLFISSGLAEFKSRLRHTDDCLQWEIIFSLFISLFNCCMNTESSRKIQINFYMKFIIWFRICVYEQSFQHKFFWPINNNNNSLFEDFPTYKHSDRFLSVRDLTLKIKMFFLLKSTKLGKISIHLWILECEITWLKNVKVGVVVIIGCTVFYITVIQC